MADALSHVLAAYVLLTIAGWHVEWLTRRWVAVGMCGAAIPDLVKVEFVVDEGVVQEVVGVPFQWFPLHTLWGVLLIAGAVALLFGQRRRRAYAVLVAGGGSHLVLDGMRLYADGRASFLLYPLWWRPPTPNLYVSADWRVTVACVVCASLVYVVDGNRRAQDAPRER